MTPTEHRRLRRECDVFSGYIARLPLQDYTLEKYTDAHSRLATFSDGGRFDLLLLRLATVNSFLTRVADSYARVFTPTSLLRRKLVLLFAILETGPASEKFLERVDATNKLGLGLKLLQSGLFFCFSLMVTAVLLGPLQLVMGRTGREPRGRGKGWTKSSS